MLNKVLVRLRNVKVLTAVVSGLIMILVNLGVIDVDMSAKAMDTFNILLGIGIAVGVFGNPDSHIKE